MPTVFVAFGVTGDLMRQKILPELFILHTKGELPENFEIIGVSRKEWGDADLREYVRNILKEKSNESPAVESFVARLSFVQGDVSDDSLFAKLAETLGRSPTGEVIGEREAILYFSLSPALYMDAFEKLVRSPLAKRAGSLRLMIEKPFGTSSESAQELNKILHSVFTEAQLYRVDHYLAKESLMHLPAQAGLPNIETEKLQHISISFLQTEGVEKRGVFFDAIGALRDVGQNHMLEMFAALVPAEPRAVVIGDLHVLTPEEVTQQTTHHQYAGYHDIPGVAPGSQTETSFTIETSWRGIPVFFEGGKYRAENKKEIALLYLPAQAGQSGQEQRFPIEDNKVRKEHERLILDCLRGDHALFMSAAEVAAQWRFIDPILKVWYQ